MKRFKTIDDVVAGRKLQRQEFVKNLNTMQDLPSLKREEFSKDLKSLDRRAKIAHDIISTKSTFKPSGNKVASEIVVEERKKDLKEKDEMLYKKIIKPGVQGKKKEKFKLKGIDVFDLGLQFAEEMFT